MKFLTLFLVCFFAVPAFAQEEEPTKENLPGARPTWLDFYQRQKEIQKEQKEIRQLLNRDLRDIRQKLQQININILSWTESNQGGSAGINPEKMCPFMKTAGNEYLKYTIIGLAVLGVFLLYSNVTSGIRNLFSRKKQ